MQSPGHGRLEGDGNETAQARDAIRRIGASVEGSRLQDRIAERTGVAVGQHMVVAEDVEAGRHADSVSGRAGRPPGENVVDAGGDGPCRNPEVTHTVAPLRGADSTGQTLDSSLRGFVPAGEGFPDGQDIGLHPFHLGWQQVRLAQRLLRHLVCDQKQNRRLTRRFPAAPLNAERNAPDIGPRLLGIEEIRHGSPVGGLGSFHICRRQNHPAIVLLRGADSSGRPRRSLCSSPLLVHDMLSLSMGTAVVILQDAPSRRRFPPHPSHSPPALWGQSPVAEGRPPGACG